MRIKDRHDHTLQEIFCLIFYQLLSTTSIVNEDRRKMRILIFNLWFKGLTRN